MSRGGAEEGEVPVARVELKARARYHLGQQPGVPGRDGLVRIPVMDRCRHGDGTELETPGPHEHPQVLGDSPAAAAERLGVPGQEGRAHAGLGQRASWSRSGSTTKKIARPSAGRTVGGPMIVTSVPPARTSGADRSRTSPR
jgi:hypothetical protein